MQQLLRERIVHHLGDLLLAHADLLSASEGLSVPNNVPNLGGCAIHPSAGKTNSAKFTPCIAPVRRRQAKPRWPSQDGGRHPRVPHSPPTPIISPLDSYQSTTPSMKIIHLRYIPWSSSALQLACR